MHRAHGVIRPVADGHHPDAGYDARLWPRGGRRRAQQLSQRLDAVKRPATVRSCDGDLSARDAQHVALGARGRCRDRDAGLLKQPAKHCVGGGFADHNMPGRIGNLALPDNVEFRPVAGAQLFVQLAGREEIFGRSLIADDDASSGGDGEHTIAPLHLLRDGQQIDRLQCGAKGI